MVKTSTLTRVTLSEKEFRQLRDGGSVELPNGDLLDVEFEDSPESRSFERGDIVSVAEQPDERLEVVRVVDAEAGSYATNMSGEPHTLDEIFTDCDPASRVVIARPADDDEHPGDPYLRDPPTDFAPVESLSREAAERQAELLREALREHDHRNI